VPLERHGFKACQKNYAGGPQLPAFGNCGSAGTTLALCHAGSIASIIPEHSISLPSPATTAMRISLIPRVAHNCLRLAIVGIPVLYSHPCPADSIAFIVRERPISLPSPATTARRISLIPSFAISSCRLWNARVPCTT
jgi:hypothetical protein